MPVLRLLLLLGLMPLFSGCIPQGLPEQRTMPPKVAGWSQEIHRQLNAFREEKGLPPLARHDGLEQLALDHCEWLVDKRGTSFIHGSNVSHSGQHYRSRVARIEHGMEAWGENVGYIGHTPDDPARRLILLWQNSPSHRKAMLGNWTHAATGIRVDEDGAIFATMNFGRTKTE